MAVTAERDYLYGLRERIRVSVYKKIKINYSIHNKDLRLVIKTVLYLIIITYTTISLALKT